MITMICDCCKQPMNMDGPKRPAFQFKMEMLKYSLFGKLPEVVEEEKYHICRECFDKIRKECQNSNKIENEEAGDIDEN